MHRAVLKGAQAALGLLTIHPFVQAGAISRLDRRIQSYISAYNNDGTASGAANAQASGADSSAVSTWSDAYGSSTATTAANVSTSMPASESAAASGVTTAPSMTSTLATLSSDTNSTDDESQDSLQCPNGGNWQVWTEDFQELDPDTWTASDGSSTAMEFGDDGMTMKLGENLVRSNLHATVIVPKAETLTWKTAISVQSASSWRAPLTMSLVAKTDGAGGIVDAFILKPSEDTGEEIDLEIAGETFQLPVWVDGDYRLRKDGKETLEGTKDVHQTLFNGATETGAYFYRYKGDTSYKPQQWNTYRLSWELDHISWAVGREGEQQQRVRFDRLTDKFPLGPLPVRFGPWATDPATSGDWAGHLDWAKNPNPTFQIKSLRMEGCRAT